MQVTGNITRDNLSEAVIASFAKSDNERLKFLLGRLIPHLHDFARETKLSLGIVAFSEAQQSEIESALGRLAEEDAEFAARLEAEYTREENDQFCGLIVKNLENIQGDERDVIILSICYGPDANGRMLMNFGPINQRGGEKRLNVIFSRARHHMAIVTSIRHHAITNDYNDGANSLKNFLHYAEAVSLGDQATARRVLENLMGNALKYSAKVASPRIEIGQMPATNPAVYFVRDNGAGFDMQHADKLFGLFQRLHSAREFPGTGVGLAGVKNIIARHGGRVWAEAQAGQGACFYFTLISVAEAQQRQRDPGAAKVA